MMNFTDALEDVRLAKLQLEFSIRLLSYCELDKMDPQKFDTDHLILLKEENIHFPKGHFSDLDNIIRAASVSVSLAFAASALALDKAYEVAGLKPDPSSEDNSIKLRTLVYMVRCAYAHGIAEPKWKVKGKYRKLFSIELDGETIEIDFPVLDGTNFAYEQIGGHRMWLRILDESLSVLRKINDNNKQTVLNCPC